MNRFCIADLHLGHKNILGFSGALRGGTNVDEHDEWIVEQWNSVVQKRDVVYVLGDVTMGKKKIHYMHRLNGQKHLIRGNHDTLSTHTYLKYFTNVYGILKKHGFWFTHAPIHPQELRGCKNIHGHVHGNIILDKFGNPDDRYISVCVEANYGVPISLDYILEKHPVTERKDR